MRKKIISLLMLVVLIFLCFNNSSVVNAEECFTVKGSLLAGYDENDYPLLVEKKFTFYESDFPLSTDYPDDIYEYYTDPTDPYTATESFQNNYTGGLTPLPYTSSLFYMRIGKDWFDQYYSGLNPALAQPWLFARYDVVKKFLDIRPDDACWFYSRVQEKHLGTIYPQSLEYIKAIDDMYNINEIYIYNPNNISTITEQSAQQQTTETSIAQTDTQETKVTESVQETPSNNTYTSSNFTITTGKRKFEATLNEVSKPTYKVIVNGVDINYYLLKTSTSNKFTFTNLQSGYTYNVEARARSNFGDNVYQESLTIKIP